jgi:hypothetical protein
MPILRTGQRLGAYVVAECLGRGGMAEVYRARHLTLERDVAVKVLSPAYNADPTFALRFLREARAVGRLNHPNIITVHDYGEQGTFAYLVMDLASGGTMREQARGYLTLADAMGGLTQVASGLQYAHEQGIVHRDLKPLNVLAGDQGRLLLADFGLARVASESIDLALSETGAVFGTPQYMAPEQALGLEVDRRADIYAFGIMTYELLTGRLPYEGASSFQIMQQQVSAPPPSLQMLLPAAPAALDEAIKRATAKQPEQRFASVAEFAQALGEVAMALPELPIGVAARGTGPGARSFSRASLPVRVAADVADSAPAQPTAEQAHVEDAPSATELEEQQEEEDQQATWLPTAWIGASDSTATVDAVSAQPTKRRRRPTSFSELQWLTFIAAAVLIIGANAIGLWLARAGRSAAGSNGAAKLTTAIFDHLGGLKSSLAGLALILAALAVISMRSAIIDKRDLSPHTYRLLRQYHRFVGYGAITIAFAIGLLTCVGIFGFGTSTPRVVLHSLLGTALLLVICAKLAVVRYYPTQRRHLKLLGESLLLLFALVFASSAVPFVWEQISGQPSKTPAYNPYGLHLPSAVIERV